MIQLIRSKRKTICLTIKDDGALIVRAPNGARIEYINKFVEQKQSWILKQKKLMKSFLKTKNSIKFINKNGVLFLDQRVRPEGLNISNREEICVWTKLEAKKYIEKRVNYFCNKFDYDHGGIRITAAKRRWGSCGAKNNLNFSWKLIMAPKKAVDYVIIHEIAHFKHKNHSARFWSLVEKMMPDYKKYDKWLENHRYLLDLG